MINLLKRFWIHVLFSLVALLISFATSSQGRSAYPLKFEQLSTLNGLPSNEVQRIYQDKNGYIWIGTSSGLCQYDGYQIKTYKSNLYTLNLLSNNEIHCIAEDNNNHLWIGTYEGLNVMDKTTGRISRIDCEGLRNSLIERILITRKNRIFVATDRGLYQYHADKDTAFLYRRETTEGVMPQTAIKSLIEDSYGYVWIGTWSQGFFRYNPESDKFFSYPAIDARNSAHVIFEDSKRRIWIGTWNEGLYLLEKPEDLATGKWKNFRHNLVDKRSLSDNIVYDIAEDINTGSIWVGTRSGLSILPLNNPDDGFTNYMPDNSAYSISYNEVNTIIRDRRGIMWIGMLGGGVNYVNTKATAFALDRLDDVKINLSTNSVRSLLVDDDDCVWLGIGSYGLVMKDKSGRAYYLKDLKDFRGIDVLPTINTIVQSPTTKAIWFGTFGGGIMIYDKQADSNKRVTILKGENAPWLTNLCVYDIEEDVHGNSWIATRGGICLYTKEKKGYNFSSYFTENKEILECPYVVIKEDSKGTIWAGTTTNGVIRVVGNSLHPEKINFKKYSLDNGSLNAINVQCLFEDSKKRLWAGTSGGGLNLYDPKSDTFISVNDLFNFPTDIIFNIQEDGNGNLWIGTNVGLVKLHVPNDMNRTSYRLFTTSDGLQDNVFNRAAAFKTKTGEMYFGGHRGYNRFYPDKMVDEEIYSPIVITDIKVFNQSWASLDEKLKNKISSLTPEFTRKIVLPYDHNNFSIEFAALSYVNPSKNKYAYYLEGFDKEWEYSNADRRFAYYNNLKPGVYTFHLKAANENGIWTERAENIQVVILPPPWKTWWAFAIYCLLILFVGYIIFRTVKKRIKLKNDLHLRELEKDKADEVNQAKLQFFTNVTHELMTPLTIISAAVDELKRVAPNNSDHYRVMTNNINRLVRLLQQILEFRKAESGNLRLKVSKGDLAAFTRKSYESFCPLMKKKNMHFSIVCSPEPFYAYFDPDKIDKILYNLLSNASKYNDPGNTVWVNLMYDEVSRQAVITVEDNGKGMSNEATKTLFRRFYEGDYRKYNTIGTGIGLSLTKDLAELHGGIITVESELNKGTKFKVVIPVNREAYNEDEIDDEAIELVNGTDILNFEEIREDTIENKTEAKHTVLLVEDNEDLLSLMVKLLSFDYTIYTAESANKAIEIIQREEIDLVVSDIMMPGMDGIEFCKYMKGTFDTCHIPVILLTAKNKEEDRVEAYNSGADGFITKPFNLSVLNAKIENLLKAKERIAGDFKKQLVFEAKALDYTTIDEQFLQRAIDCVHRHLDDSEFDQQLFVKEMSSSKSTLYKKLLSLTGLNTSSFIRNIRLKAACRIMEEKKNIRISEVAYAVGFNDPKYFSACFKKEFGILPTEYIERYMPDTDFPDL